MRPHECDAGAACGLSIYLQIADKERFLGSDIEAMHDAQPLIHPWDQLVVFRLDDQRYALHLAVVERVVRMVDITPLPKAPEIVLGVVNVQGRILPVVHLRRRFRFAERAIHLSDHLIIARTSKRTVALVVDEVSSVVSCSAQEVRTVQTILPAVEYVQGVLRLEDGMVLIHDLDTALSLAEEQTLDAALQEGKPAISTDL